MNSQTVASQTPGFNDREYADFLDEFRHHFRDRVVSGVPVYTTTHGDLYELYLSQYPLSVRQTYRCRACEHFIRNYGGLVTIDDHGIAKPLLWSDGIFRPRMCLSSRPCGRQWRVHRSTVYFCPKRTSGDSRGPASGPISQSPHRLP